MLSRDNKKPSKPLTLAERYAKTLAEKGIKPTVSNEVGDQLTPCNGRCGHSYPNSRLLNHKAGRWCLTCKGLDLIEH